MHYDSCTDRPGPSHRGWEPVVFSEKCLAWYAALPDDLQAEVRGIVGIIPDWVVASLEAAGIPAVAVEVDGGPPLYLMPTSLMLYLADKPGT
ncbi:MAG: hypothetical protein JWM34_1646 [Ilumatobacteraceae bacterium]|nr:hypothetical protein [Ilumatobacteraceae bacterium]